MRFMQYVLNEWRQLAQLNRSDRPWEMPVAAALAIGLPIFIGVAQDELGLGLAASLGGLVFLYLPPTRLSHRVAWLMACAFGMTGSHALGLLGHLWPSLVVPILTIITILVMMICRFYAVPPPGGLFFVMAAAIGAYSPVHGREALLQVGAVALGALLALAIAFIYSLYILSRRRVLAVPQLLPDFNVVVVESVVIGVFVGLSLLAAHALQLQRPYWVPVSCLAIIQGASLRAAWSRQLHRSLGTALGLLVFWGIAHVPLGPWGVASVLTVLALLIETLVVRHYGLATVFITPMAILLTEAAQTSAIDPQALMYARLADTMLGAFIGVVGAACLHSPRIRDAVGSVLRRLWPEAGSAAQR